MSLSISLSQHSRLMPIISSSSSLDIMDAAGLSMSSAGSSLSYHLASVPDKGSNNRNDAGSPRKKDTVECSTKSVEQYEAVYDEDDASVYDDQDDESVYNEDDDEPDYDKDYEPVYEKDYEPVYNDEDETAWVEQEDDNYDESKERAADSDCTAETMESSTVFERDMSMNSHAMAAATTANCLESTPEEESASVASEPCVRRRSSMKLTQEEIPLSIGKKSWKTLPPPDMKTIHKARAISTESYFHSAENQNQQQRRRRTVTFVSVQIREYDLTLGDNPSVSYGPPISLDWDYEEMPEVDLEDYEHNRGPRRKLRQMLLNYYQRKNILIHTYGHSESEIKHHQKQVNKIKNQRAVTKTFLQFHKVEDFCQSARRKAKRLGGKKNKSANV